MPVIASPLRYPGGKTVYADMLKEIVQLNNLQGGTFVEAFAGGAGAAMTLLLRGDVDSIILNDFDCAIYSFWYSILNYTDEFIEKLLQTPVTIQEWRKQKKIYLNERDDIFSLGFATFFLNRSNRAGIIRANPVGGIHQKGKYRINARFKPERLAIKIKKIAEYKDRIQIFNLDAVDLIKMLHRDFTGENIFIYFDPPYYKKGQMLYFNHYKHQGHENLSLHIKGCQYPWVLSYDDAIEIKELYEGFEVYYHDLTYSVVKPSRAHELIISNLKMPDNLISAKIQYQT